MEKFKNILALDTAMSGCGAAVLSEGRIGGGCERMPRGQSEVLMPMVCTAVEQAGVEFGDIDAVVTTLGPGAFTGLRIGMSCAKALALSLDVPIYGVSTLQALALAVVEGDHVEGVFRVLVDPRRDDFYVQDFDRHGKPLAAAALMSFDEVSESLEQVECVVGDAAQRFCALREEKGGDVVRVIEGFDYPDPAVMARGLLRNAEVYTDVINPIYLRGADIGVSKKVYRTLA